MSTYIEKQDTISSLEKALSPVLQDKASYKRLLASNASNAQKLLDSFQRLLDEPELELSRKNLIVATQRLAVRSGLYPKCHELKDVEQIGDDAVAAGGFADIYKGLFQGKVVCLKMIRVYEQSDIEHVLKKFSNEVMLWAQMNHRNILTIFGLYKFQNRLALVMPWIENGDVGKYLKDHPDAPRMLLAEDVSKGLEYLHSEGVVHGDLKGANILVDDAGRACLADFGISAVSDPNILAWTTQSSASSSGGSARWQAPELFLVPENDEEEEEKMKNTVASDVYALGCVFLEIFTGRIPFAEIQNDFAVIIRVKNGGQPARPPSSSPCWTSWGMTEDLWSLMERCWVREPTDRLSASAITEHLAANRIPDLRGSPETDWIPRALFRHEMNKTTEVISVEDLHHILTLTEIPSNDSLHHSQSSSLEDIGDGLPVTYNLSVRQRLELNPVQTFNPITVTEIPPPTPSNDFPYDLDYNSFLEDSSSEDIGDSWWSVTYNPSVKQRIALDGPVQTLKSDCYVHCKRISHDGKFLATASDKFRIFDTTTAAEVYCFPRISEEDDYSFVLVLCFSRDGKYLATGDDEGLVRIWDIVKQRVHLTFNGSNSSVQFVEFSSDGDFLVSVHRDSTVEIWYMSDLEPKTFKCTPFSDLRSPVGCAALSPNDQFIAICQGSMVYIWDITTQHIVDRLEHKSRAWAVAFNQNGDGLLSGTDSGTMKYWDLTNLLNAATGTLRQAKRQKLKGEGNWYGSRQPGEVRSPCVREFIIRDGINDVVISHDGQWAVLSSYRRVYILDIHTGIAHTVIDLPYDYDGSSIDITSEGLLAITCYLKYVDDQLETRIWRFNTIDEPKLGEGKRV